MRTNYGLSEVVWCSNEQELGRASAALVAGKLRDILARQPIARAVFSAGQSQGSFLKSLAMERDVPWNRVDCFNIDDFWDVKMPQTFTCGHQIFHTLFQKVKPRTIHLVKYNAPDPDSECRRYASLLHEVPVDVLCLGIGTSGHLALNEPDSARFDDPEWVRLVDVAEQSKKQLRDDPNFKNLGYIPLKGITMTIPAILSAKHCITIVPLALKKPILTRLAAISKPTPSLPASILLEKEGLLFVDSDSCPEAWKKQKKSSVAGILK